MVAPQRINSAPAPTPAPAHTHTRTCDCCDEPLDFEFIGECGNCGTCFGNVCCECERERDWDDLPIRCDDDAIDGVRQLCCYCDPNWEHELTCDGCGEDLMDTDGRSTNQNVTEDVDGRNYCEECAHQRNL